jgi:hypothetical protein
MHVIVVGLLPAYLIGMVLAGTVCGTTAVEFAEKHDISLDWLVCGDLWGLLKTVRAAVLLTTRARTLLDLGTDWRRPSSISGAEKSVKQNDLWICPAILIHDLTTAGDPCRIRSAWRN